MVFVLSAAADVGAASDAFLSLVLPEVTEDAGDDDGDDEDGGVDAPVDPVELNAGGDSDVTPEEDEDEVGPGDTSRTGGPWWEEDLEPLWECCKTWKHDDDMHFPARK